MPLDVDETADAADDRGTGGNPKDRRSASGSPRSRKRSMSIPLSMTRTFDLGTIRCAIRLGAMSWVRQKNRSAWRPASRPSHRLRAEFL